MKVQTVEQFLANGGRITKVAAQPAPTNRQVSAKGKSWTLGKPGATFRG